MAGTEREPLPGASNNIEAFLDHLKTGRNLSANTVASYRCDLFQFADFLDGAGIRALDGVEAVRLPALVLSLPGGNGRARQRPGNHPLFPRERQAAAALPHRG